MSERDLVLLKVRNAMKENTKQINAWQLNAIMCETNIKTYEKQIKHEEILFNDRVNKFKLQINRAIENAKISHATLDTLLKEKESLHLELKIASHFGQILCEYCNRYFTPQGIVRHREKCASKPEIKMEKEHKEEVNEIKDTIEAKKLALKEELKRLEKISEATEE